MTAQRTLFEIMLDIQASLALRAEAAAATPALRAAAARAAEAALAAHAMC
jgi:hypothetical protein